MMNNLALGINLAVLGFFLAIVPLIAEAPHLGAVVCCADFAGFFSALSVVALHFDCSTRSGVGGRHVFLCRFDC